jgi:hypothetical protein
MEVTSLLKGIHLQRVDVRGPRRVEIRTDTAGTERQQLLLSQIHSNNINFKNRLCHKKKNFLNS